MKYIILYRDYHEKDHTVLDSIDEVKEYIRIAHQYSENSLSKMKIFEVNKEIKIQLNEIPFKGITNE